MIHVRVTDNKSNKTADPCTSTTNQVTSKSLQIYPGINTCSWQMHVKDNTHNTTMVCSWYHYVHSFAWEKMLMLMLTMKWMHATAARCILSCSWIFRSIKNRIHSLQAQLLVVQCWRNSICCWRSNCVASILPFSKWILRICTSKSRWNRIHWFYRCTNVESYQQKIIQ